MSSSELFDKKIKEKLESINKPVSENVWKNLKQQMPVPWYIDFWRKYALPFYATITSILLLFSLKELIENHNQIEILNDKITTIQQNKSLINTQTIVHRDTIIVEKYVYYKANEDKKLLTFSGKDNSQLLRNSAFVAKSDDDSKKIAEPQKIEKSSEERSESVKTLEENLGEKKVVQTSLVNDESSVIGEKKDSVNTLKSPKVEAQQAMPSSTKRKFQWPKLQTRFGLSSSVSIAGEVNLGPMAELFLTPSLGLSAGLGFNKYPNLEYGSPQQFNQQTGQNFVQTYNSKVPKNYDALTEIGINTSILELPIALNYYIPINRKFDFKFSFGTHLDLKLYQNIKFETYYQGEEIYTNFNTYAAKNTLHNMILGAGVQYKQRNVSFILTPTYIYNFREVDYVNSGGVFRLNGSIMIDFKSK